jgi:hypothetical protein
MAKITHARRRHETKREIPVNTMKIMKKHNKLASFRFALAITAAFVVSALSTQAQSATATISGVQSGSDYNYTITLQNTGTTQLDAFFYGWPGFGPDSLAAQHVNVGNSTGWNNVVTNNGPFYGIVFAGSSGNALAAGNSATFTFTSSEAPTDITTSPQGLSVAYVGQLFYPPGSPGVSTPAFSPTLVVVPESTSTTFLAACCLGAIHRFDGVPVRFHLRHIR